MTGTTQTTDTAKRPAIVGRYGKIGIVAVTAALMFTGTAGADGKPVPQASHRFVHPLDRVGFNPQPEPPAQPLLLPAVQKITAR